MEICKWEPGVCGSKGLCSRHLKQRDKLLKESGFQDIESDKIINNKFVESELLSGRSYSPGEAISKKMIIDISSGKELNDVYCEILHNAAFSKPNHKIMFTDYCNGLSYRQIANKYKMSRMSVYRLIKKVIRKWDTMSTKKKIRNSHIESLINTIKILEGENE